MLYIAVGYGLAFGVHPDPTINAYIGSIANVDRDSAMLLFQLYFAATTATIDSGALAERTNFRSYLLVSSF